VPGKGLGTRVAGTLGQILLDQIAINRSKAVPVALVTRLGFMESKKKTVGVRGEIQMKNYEKSSKSVIVDLHLEQVDGRCDFVLHKFVAQVYMSKTLLISILMQGIMPL
jgi:hypothetical protein